MVVSRKIVRMSQSEIIVCPKPLPWNDVYASLCDWWNANGKQGPPPPIPLILNGWVYSNDKEKLNRWTLTVQWAVSNGCECVTVLPRESFYTTSILSEYNVGPLGGPMYLPWNFEKKAKPSRVQVDQILAVLKRDWLDVVGNEIGSITRPKCLTGSKFRRLLVEADNFAIPEWGSWTALPNGSTRIAFTNFRAKINQSINSHTIDHIDFLVIGNFKI